MPQVIACGVPTRKDNNQQHARKKRVLSKSVLRLFMWSSLAAPPDLAMCAVTVHVVRKYGFVRETNAGLWMTWRSGMTGEDYRAD